MAIYDAVSDARGDLGEVSLPCADGACTASWRDHDVDIECDAIAVTTYDFAFTVVDTDGHVSAAPAGHAARTEVGRRR